MWPEYIAVAFIVVVSAAVSAAHAADDLNSHSNLANDLLDAVYPYYRFEGVTQHEAEALFGSAIAAVYYPMTGEVRLLADDDLQTANQWLEQEFKGGVRGPSEKVRPYGVELLSKLRSRAQMSLRGFLHPGGTAPDVGIQITNEPYLAKTPTFIDTSGQEMATENPRRASPVSVAKDYLYYYEEFEGDVWDRWSRTDNNGGQYTWGVRSCDSYWGSYSADAARGGSQGALLGCEDAYPDSVEMYMYIEQCQTVLPAWKAYLELQFKSSIDMDGDDLFGVYMGPSFSESTGWNFWGNWSEWFTLVFNLRQWYWYGDLGENECNTLVLGFESDAIASRGYGARVDDIYVYYGDTVGSYECAISADPETGSSPLTVAFRAISDIYMPEFYWRFGDGATSDERDPVHVYADAGDYPVSLRVTDTYGTYCYATTEIGVSQGSCTYSISPTSISVGATGGTGSTSVTAPAGCSWSANTSQSWIHITSGSTGSGNGTVSFSVDGNGGTTSRSGTIQVAGKTFTVNQDGVVLCSLSISPTSRSFGSAGGDGTISVATTSGCSWVVTTNVSWISITGGGSGSGNGMVYYNVSSNPSSSYRTGTISIGAETFTVSQSGAGGPCVATSTAMCLSNNRFQVSARWETQQGDSGDAQVVKLTNDTGYLWFFNESNVEVVLKVLNGCGLNNNYWVFAGGLTNVWVELSVVDTTTGQFWTRVNPQQTAFQPIQDTSAFATCN
jgi:PKD repeat protein